MIKLLLVLYPMICCPAPAAASDSTDSDADDDSSSSPDSDQMQCPRCGINSDDMYYVPFYIDHPSANCLENDRDFCQACSEIVENTPGATGNFCENDPDCVDCAAAHLSLHQSRALLAPPEPEPESQPTCTTAEAPGLSELERKQAEQGRELLAKEAELRELQESLLHSRAPREITTYFDMYAELYLEIARLTAALAATATTIEDAPACFCCPISQTLMTTPVINSNSGMTYDCAAIETWIASERRAGRQPTCPITRRPIGFLIRNRAIEDAIEMWCNDCGCPVPVPDPPPTTMPIPAQPTCSPSEAPQGPLPTCPVPGSTGFLTAPAALAWLGSNPETYSPVYVPLLHAVYQTGLLTEQIEVLRTIFGPSRWDEFVRRYRIAMTTGIPGGQMDHNGYIAAAEQDRLINIDRALGQQLMQMILQMQQQQQQPAPAAGGAAAPAGTPPVSLIILENH